MSTQPLYFGLDQGQLNVKVRANANDIDLGLCVEVGLGYNWALAEMSNLVS